MNTKELKELVLSNPRNRSVLSYLNLTNSQNHFCEWDDSGYDEGAQTFYLEYGALIPKDTRYEFGTRNIMVCKESGLIFGFQHGRFTFFIRLEIGQARGHISRQRRIIHSLDGDLDITELEDEWCHTWDVIEEGEEATYFKTAFEQACDKR